MGTVIIFLLITILAGIGAIRSLKDKKYTRSSIRRWEFFSVWLVFCHDHLKQRLSCLNKDKKKHRSGCFFLFSRSLTTLYPFFSEKLVHSIHFFFHFSFNITTIINTNTCTNSCKPFFKRNFMHLLDNFK